MNYYIGWVEMDLKSLN